MITLRNKLYESLLDDEDDLINNGDNVIILNDRDNIFYKHFTTMDEWFRETDEIPIVNKNKIIFKESIVINENHKPLSSYISGVNTIEAKRILWVLKNKVDETDKTLCKNLKADIINFHTENTSTIKNINININKINTGFISSGCIFIRGKGENGWRNSENNFNNPPIIFENVNIKTPGECIFNISGSYLPRFINTKFSCKKLSFIISSSRMPEQKSVLNDIDKYLDMNYVLKIKDLKTGEEIEKSKLNLKEISTISGNFVYKLLQPISKFKQGTKITDIFPDLPPITDEIDIFKYNMNIKFHKETSIVKNMWGIKEFAIHLDDGWVMEIWKNRIINATYQNINNWG